MSKLTAQQIATFWISANGSDNGVVTAVAVAMAESGGDTTAVSPQHDYGLWQINQMNFATYGLTVERAFNPELNALVAVKMSGHGTNWGPWCTAWVQPVGHCGSFLGPYVQKGSPADGWLAWAGAALGKTPGLTVTPDPPKSTTPADHSQMSDAWSAMQSFTQTWAPARGNTANGLIQRAKRVR